MGKSFFFKNYDFSIPALIPDYSKCRYVGLGQARSLGRLGVPVYGTGRTSGVSSEFSRYIRMNFSPRLTPSESHDQLLEYLIDIADAIGRKSVLLITLDSFAKFAAKHRDILRNYFYMPRLDSTLVEGLCDKKRTHIMALENGMPTVKTGFPESIEEVMEFSEKALFPVIMKAVDWSTLERRPPNILTLLQSREELLQQYRKISMQVKSPSVILQEYVHGVRSQEWIFQGYFDDQSKCLIAFTGEKLRQFPIFGGTTTLGVISKNEFLQSMAITFLRAIRYSGIVDMDYIYDHRDGMYKILDANPRIGANFRIFVGENGLDVVRAMYLDLTAKTVPQDIQIEGRKWIVEDRDLLASITSYRQGSLSLTGWIRSLRGIKEGAWFALDDPLPFLTNGLNYLANKIRR